MHHAPGGGPLRHRLFLYAVAVIITGATLGLRLGLGYSVGDQPVLSLFLLPIILSAYLGGIGPGVTATGVAVLLANYFLLPASNAFTSSRPINLLQTVALLSAGALVSILSEALRRARHRADVGRRLHAVTLASIGDAVITTDLDGRIAFLNAEAERLSGWTQREAAGRPVGTIAHLQDEITRAPVDDLVRHALQPGDASAMIVHAVLRARGGREWTVDVSTAPIREPDGRVLGVVFVLRDCTERSLAEGTRAHLAAIVESSDDAIVSQTLEGRITSWNGGAERLFGRSAEEAIGAASHTLFPTQLVADERMVVGALAVGKPRVYFEMAWTRGDGTPITVSLSISPLRNHNGVIVGTSMIARDITERKRAERALRESEERFRRALENIPDVVVIYDRDLRIQYINGATRKVTGRPALDFLGHTEEEIWPPEVYGIYLPTLRQAAATGTTLSIDADIALPATGTRSLRVTCVPITDEHGVVREILGITRDFTEQRQTNEQIRASLREKEVLLKEIHHRVKNNLQVISSLLSLQASRLKESEAQLALRESQYRVRSMSLVHEKLYGSQNLASINFGDYLDAVTTELMRSLARPGITRMLDVEPIDLEIDTAIPCGLIANELVTNALKHGFPAGMQGTIIVSLHRKDPHTVVLTVRDTGIGLPPGDHAHRLESMGMTLIHSLTDQISGTVIFDGGGGTYCAVTFPG
jgi:PAS domain S-box-containing protein